MKVTLKFVTLILLFFILNTAACCTGNGGTVNPGEIPPKKDIFTFLVAGDSRSEVYLTGGSAQDQAMREVIFISYGLDAQVRPPITADMIRAGYKLTFDPQTDELRSVEAPAQAPGRYIDFYRDGWPVLRRTYKDGNIDGVIMRDTGRKWVNSRVAEGVNRGAQFIIHGGDFILDGTLGQTLDDNPYWQLFYKELVSKIIHLPPLRIGNIELEGRIFGVIGNHELYRDENASGFFSALPWLKKLGMKPDYRIYSFPFRNCFFIFLDSGPGSDPVWDSKYPGFKTQMDYLTARLEEARKNKANHVFVVYHKPTFVKAGHGPLPEDQSPHKYLKQFANELNIYVFNSHSHTTEQYEVDDVNYFVLGGGGATQNLEIGSHPSPEPEYYWRDTPRVEEYNYMEVKINGAHIECLIHRFRPTETMHPLGVVPVIPRPSSVPKGE
jgi:hypothetical protein